MSVTCTCIEYYLIILLLFDKGCCGENTARKYKISREQQDEYAINSYKKSQAAAKAGVFESQITPVTITAKRGKNYFYVSMYFF